MDLMSTACLTSPRANLNFDMTTTSPDGASEYTSGYGAGLFELVLSTYDGFADPAYPGCDVAPGHGWTVADLDVDAVVNAIG